MLRGRCTPCEGSALRGALILGLAAALLAAPVEARANNEASLRLSNSYLVDDGLFALSERSWLLQAELSYARALFDPARGLWLEASWIVGSRRADLFGLDLEARGTMQALTVGVRYTWPVLPWLVPQSRAGLGVVLGRLSLQGSAAAQGGVSGDIDDLAAGLTGYLLAGVQLLVPRPWMMVGDSGVTAGVVIEGGVSFSTPLSFTLAPEQDPDLRTIPLQATDLGSIHLGGGVLRIGVLLRF